MSITSSMIMQHVPGSTYRSRMVPDPVDLQPYIQAHIAEIGNAEDVKATGGPCENLRKSFRRRTGVTLGRYIERMRIGKAKQLLE